MILVGITLVMKALNVQRAIVGIENKKDAVALHKESKSLSRIEVQPLKVQYPQEARTVDRRADRSSGTLRAPHFGGGSSAERGYPLAIYEVQKTNRL